MVMSDEQNFNMNDVNAQIANFGTLNVHGDLIISGREPFPLPLPEKPIFISYSRANREFAETLRANLEKIGFKVWRDVHDMQVGDDWWRQIAEAIDGSHTMVLCMSPEALASPVVAKEWQYARQVGTRVMPVFAADIDFEQVPRWMGRADWADFRAGAAERNAVWGRFVDQLRRDYLPKRVPFMADDLPPYFVERPDEFESMVNALVDQNGAVAITAAVSGAGGFGKTMLATALCHDTRVRGAFDDGVLWVTLGEKPSEGDRIRKALDLVYLLTGTRPNVQAPESVKTALREAIGDRYILLVLDDLWRKHDAHLFLTDAPNCAVVITTRYDHTLPDDTRFRQNVDAMRLEQAVKLLTWQIDTEDHHTPALETLAKRLGEWAVILRLANGQLRKQISRGKSLDDALGWVDKALTRKGLKAFDPKDPDQRIDAVSSTIRASLELLDDDTATQFARLAVFPEDAVIPFTTLERLWDSDDFDTEDAASAIHEAGLLRDFDLDARTIRLHDVIRQFLVDEHSDSLVAWHGEIVDSYGDLTTLPDDYAWRNIAYHLSEADRADTLRALVLDLPFIQAKLTATDPGALASDAAKLEKGDPIMRIMRSFWQVSAHVLTAPENHDQLINQLIGRLGLHQKEYPDIGLLLEDARKAAENHPAPLLILQQPSLRPAGGMLEHILDGHRDAIVGVIELSDGRILSWSQDSTLRLWTADGQVLAVLNGHRDPIVGAVELSDGRILSWSQDSTLRLWTANGKVLAILNGHSRIVRDATELFNGYILSWADDSTIRLWTSDGEPWAVLQKTGDIRSILILSEERWLSLSASGEMLLWYIDWDLLDERPYWHSSELDSLLSPLFSLESHNDRKSLWTFVGESPKILNDERSYFEGIIRLSNGRLLSWARDNTLQLWSIDGEPIKTLRGHEATVEDVIELSNNRLLSWARDNTLQLWSIDGEPIKTLRGHNATVEGVIELNNGHLLSWDIDPDIVSASAILWSADGELLVELELPSHWIQGATAIANGQFVSWQYNEFLCLWTPEGELLTMLQGHTKPVLGGLALRDERFLSWSEDNILLIWSILNEPSKELEERRQHIFPSKVNLVGAHSRFLIWSEIDPMAMMWSTHGKLLALLEGHTGWIWGASALNNQRFLTWSLDGTLRIWSANGVEELVLEGHMAPVIGVLILDDGRFLSWAQNGTLRLWSADGELLQNMEGHMSEIKDVTMLQDGRFLSWSSDNTLRLWLSDGKPQAVMRESWRNLGLIGALALADGRFLSWTRGGRYGLWNNDGDFINEIDYVEGERLRRTTTDKVPKSPHHFHWETIKTKFIGIKPASDVELCSFIADAHIGASAQLPTGEIAVAGEDGALHFLRPNAALRRIMAE
jgi:WD40 repeat protein